MMSPRFVIRDGGVQKPMNERATVRCLLAGGVVAIPTEGVWGLSASIAHLHAVQRILNVKRRAANKGLIVLVSEWSMVDHWIDPAWSREWPIESGRPATWVVPVSGSCPEILTGGRQTLAVRRVTMRSLSRVVEQTGPLVSTSANRSGRPSSVSRYQVILDFARTVDYIATGRTGGHQGPSMIKDLVTGQVLRGGHA
jgi:L-threonylcarbamoyladenylate synthase